MALQQMCEGEVVGVKVLWNSMPECAAVTVLSFL